MMDVSLINDGPVTLSLDSRDAPRPYARRAAAFVTMRRCNWFTIRGRWRVLPLRVASGFVVTVLGPLSSHSPYHGVARAATRLRTASMLRC